MSVMSRTMIPATLRRLTSTSLLPADGGAVHEADTGATAPETGVGLGNGAPATGVLTAEDVALGECPGVGCDALLLLPHAASITAAAIPSDLRKRMRGAILLLPWMTP